MTLINILTRTGTRKSHFKTLKDSISTQDYKHIRHIKSNDNPNCQFLQHEDDVFEVKRNRKLGKGFYNTYLNLLGNQVTEGWVIILDDDSKLINPSFIQSLAEECSKSKKNEILIFRSQLGINKDLYPPETEFENKSIKRARIDMSCFCMHNSVLHKYQFNGQLLGDFRFLSKLKKSNMFNFKFLNDLPVGIWANYEGAKSGKN